MPGNPTVTAVSNPGQSVVTFGGASVVPINVVSVVPAALAVASQPSVNLTPAVNMNMFWPSREFMAEYMERIGPQRLLNLETRIALYQAEQAIQSALNTLMGLTSNLMRPALYTVEGTPVARPGGHMVFLEGIAAPNIPVARLEAIANALQPLNTAEAAIRALPNPFGMPLTAASVRSFLNTLNMAQNAIGQAEQVLPALFNLANEGFWRAVGVTPQDAMNLLALGQLASGMLISLGRALLGQVTTGVGGPLSLTRSLGGTHIFQGPEANFLRLGNEINESVRSALQALQALNVNAFRAALGRLNVDLAQFMSDLPSMMSALGPFEAAQLALIAGQLGVPNAARALQGINDALRLYVNQTTSVIADTLGFAQWLQQSYRTLEGMAYQPFLGGASYYGQPQPIGQAYEVPLARPINTGPGAYGLTETTITTVGVNASPQAIQVAQAAGLGSRLSTLALGIYSASSDYLLQLGNEAAQLNQVYSQLQNAWNSYINAVNSGNYGEALRALQELTTNYGQAVNAVNAINDLANQIANSAVPYLQQLGNMLSQQLGEALGRVSSQIDALNNLLSSNNLSALFVGSLSVSPTGRLSAQVVIGSNRVNLSDFIQGVKQLQLNAQNYVSQLNNIISVLQNARNDPVQALSYAISLLSGGAQGITSIASNLNTLSAQLSFAANTLSEYVNAGRARINITNLPAEVESALTQVGRLFADLGVDFRSFVSELMSGNFVVVLGNGLSQMDRLIANMRLNLSSMRMIDVLDTMATFDTLFPILAPVAGARLLSQTSSLVNDVDTFISSARSLLAQVQTALSEGLSLAQVGGSNAWVTLYDTSRTAIYDLLRGLAIGLGSDAQLLGQALGNIPQLRDASNFLISHGNWLVNWRPSESIVNAAANVLAYSVPVVGPLSHLAAYWNQESDLDKLFDIVMAGLSAFFVFDALDNFTAGFYRSLADIVAQEARASGGTIDVMDFLMQNPDALARAFSAGVDAMLNGGVIQNLPGLLTVLKNIAVSVGFSEAFTLGMAAAEHRLNTNDLTALLISGAMLGILTYAMSAALGIGEEFVLNLLTSQSGRELFQSLLTSVLTRFGDVLNISADEAPEIAARATNSLFGVLSSSAFRAIATRLFEFFNAGAINAGIAYAAANGRLTREQLWNYFLQGVLYGVLFFAGTQYFANLIGILKGTNAMLVDVYKPTPVEASPAGARTQLSFFDAVKASLLTALGVPADDALRWVLSDRAVLLRGTLFGFDPQVVKSTADNLWGSDNYKLFVNTLPNGKTIAFAIPTVDALTDQVSEISADQLADPNMLASLRAKSTRMVNVLLPEKSTDIIGVSKFYYIETSPDLLGGLGRPIETFNKVGDLLSFLRSLPDPEDYMVITDGYRFMVYQRSIYMIMPDQLADPGTLAMLGANANKPGFVNVLLYEGPTGPNDTGRFYYFTTRLDLLGGGTGLGNPIATFDNPQDLMRFLTWAQNFGDYMVITDGKTFMVYPRNLYEIPASELGNPDVLSMFRNAIASNTVNVLVYEGPTGPNDTGKFYYFTTEEGLLSGNSGLGEPIATFNNANDLVKFLSNARNPEDLMILTDGNTFEVYPRSFYMPREVDSGKILIIVDNDSMGRLLTVFNLIKSGGVPGGSEVNVLNRQPVFLLRDPAGILAMAIGYDSLAKPISVAEMVRLMLGEGVNPGDVGEVVSLHATATPPAEPGESFTTVQSKANPPRTAAANNFYLAPGLFVRGALVPVADDGTIEDENIVSNPAWLRLGYYFYLGARNESLVPGVPGEGYFIEVRKIPLVDPLEAGNLTMADVLARWEQTVNRASLVGTVEQTAPYENTLVLRGRIPGLFPEYQTYLPATGEVPYFISVPPSDPNYYRLIGEQLGLTKDYPSYVEIVDSNGNVIASSTVNDPADLGRFIVGNADKIQPGYRILVGASPADMLDSNVLLPVRSTDIIGVSKFYYIPTRLDLLGGDRGLGDPIATFDNPNDLLSFLRSLQDPEDYMVLTDGYRFAVYQRSLFTLTPDQLTDPNVLAMFKSNANMPGLVNVLLYEGPTDPFDTPKFYYIVTRLDLLGGGSGLGNPIATFDDPVDLLTFLRSAQNLGDYMIVTDGTRFMVYPRDLYEIPASRLGSPDVLAMLRTKAPNSVYVDNSLAIQLKALAKGGNLALSMFNRSGAPAFRWGIALYNMEGGEAGITRAFIPDVRIGDTTVTLGVEFDRPITRDDYAAFVQALLSARSPDDVINTLNNYGARIEMARIDNTVMFFNGEAAPDGGTFVNTLLSGGVNALRRMASDVMELVRWANNDIGAYTLWIGRQIEGAPTILNPTEVANMRFMSWANGGSLYLNASVYNAETGAFYDFYMRPGVRIELGNEVQENGMYYSGAYGLISELSNIGRGSPSPWGEIANLFGRLAGEILYGLTGNYIPVGMVLGTPRGVYTPRTDVFLGQGIEETPQAVMPMEELQMQAQAALARPLAYIAPNAVLAQLAESSRTLTAQPAVLGNIERAVPALRSLDNMVTALLQLGTGGIAAQAAEAIQAERGGALALPQFSEVLRQFQARNLQPGQALTAEIVTPQAASLEQVNITPREAGLAVQQIGQAQQIIGQETLQLGRQVGQPGQAQRGYAIQPAQQLAQLITQLQLARAGQEVQLGRSQVRLGQAQQIIGQAVQVELGQARVVQPQAVRGYEVQPYGQVAQGYETQPAQQAVQPQAEQAEQTQGYQAQPYGREQALTERPQVFQQPRQVQGYQPQPYQVQPYQPQVGYRTGYQPGQQPEQQPTQQAQQTQEQTQQEQLEQTQEQTPIPPPNMPLTIWYTQPEAPWWFRFNRAPERRAYLKEVLAL